MSESEGSEVFNKDITDVILHIFSALDISPVLVFLVPDVAVTQYSHICSSACSPLLDQVG